ncbi:hypothetical protein G6F42_012952 [Rhizopus arrhizus]|nr:hypothetical protein G6F42_012952 [Rhizopus arrhizus]
MSSFIESARRQQSDEPAIISVDELSFPIKIKTTRNQGIPIHHLLCDVPLESQCLDVITAAGTHGAVQKDVSIALNSDEMRSLSKLLEKLSELKPGQGHEHYGVVRYLEFEGRIRRYRYFTLAASIKVNEGIDYVPPALPDQETDESKYYERTIFTPMPHTMTEYYRYRKLTKKAGNRNVFYEGKSMPGFTKRKLLNPDGTPRPKSRYILQKEKKIAEMLAAKSAAEARAANPNSTESTSTSTDGPQADVEVHSFFRSKKSRIREADKHLLNPPSPTPTPAPIISQSRLACPAGVRETRSSAKAAPSKPEDAPAPKRRKRTVAAVAKKDQVAPEATSSTVTRTTRSGRVISSYTVEPVESPTTPDEESPKSQLESESQSSTQMDISQPSSEPTEPKGDTATEALTTETHTPATPPVADKPQPAPKAKRGRPRVLNKVTQPRLKNRSIADFFSRVPKGTTSPVAGTPPVVGTPSVADKPPAASTSATTTRSKTVTFAEPALESQPSSPSAVIDTIQETTVSQPENEATEVTTESTASKDTTAKEPVTEHSTDNDSTVQADVVDMEVDATNTSQQAEADKDRDNEPAPATSDTPSSTKPDTETQASTAKTAHLFRRYQHEKSQKPVNSYLEARIKIFYELLDEMRLIEMGKPFIVLFEERAAAQNKSSKYSMDMKTLWTTALELEKRGQAQTVIVDCPFLSGKTLKRKVVFHRDMSQDSEEFKSYVKFIKERRAINNSNRNMPKPVAEVDQPVVRLSEQVEQMQKEAQELLVSGQIKKAKQMELRISELSKNLETFGRQYCQNMNTYWMIEAVQYGWITARMIRAKVFHKYLYRLLEDNVDGVNQEERVITVNAICDNMSFHLIAQIIGIFKPSKLINDFYKDVNNHKVKLGDMPDDLKRDLVDENTKFLRRLRKLINGLEYIQVLTAQFTEVKDNANFKVVKYAHIAPYYKLEQKVPIIDRKQAHEPVIREHTIKTMDDLSDYWTDLKYVSTFRNAGHKNLKKLDDPNEIELRSSIHSPRNWSTRAIFTRGQRKMLNEKVDKVNRKTPLDNPQELKQIANTLDVPITVIQSYYTKIIDALDRRHRYTKEKRLERLLMGGKKRRTARSAKYNIYQGRRVITMDSNHAFVGSRRQPSKANKSYMDDMQDLPVIQDGQKFLKNKAKRKRSSWSEQDDEILLYMYTIMRHRSRQNKVKISWCPAQKVFPDRDPNSTRSRKDRLLGQSSYNEKYELYLIYWDTFYHEGIANGDITDPDPEDNANMDILSYIEYFVQRLQEFKESPVELPLPATLAQTKDMYDIMRSELINPYFEDSYHDGESLIHKLQSLYLVPFTVRKDMEATYDQPDTIAAIEDDAANRLCGVIRIYGLMALMTPAELFDPFHAYQILSKFPQHLMDTVFEQMKTEKILILACGDRPIPGTSWALSAKFMKDMSGELPVDLFNQAKEYERFLTTQTEKFKFLPYHVSSGMMACLLNLLSDNQISFGLSNLNLQMRKVIGLGFRTRGIRDATFSHLGLDIQVNDQADHAMTDASTVRKAYIKQLTNKEYDATLSNLLICLSTKESDMIKAVIHALHDQHEVGLTLSRYHNDSAQTLLQQASISVSSRF